jgi:Cd(II)/Pb(II)-responsive transcriptional regulator
MKIGDLSKATGVEVGTIRFYERAGLIDLPDRMPNGYRSYGPRHLESLAFVRHCRALDIPMADIRRLLDLATLPMEDCGNVNELVDEQIERVRARIKSLRALEKQLTVLRAKCSETHPTKECGILGELVSAAHGEACVCHP